MWRQDELLLINQNTTGAARKAALCGLLEQEAQLIASVGRHKIVADAENKDKKIQSFLNAVSVVSSAIVRPLVVRSTSVCSIRVV